MVRHVKDVAILVVSCDAYKDLWDPYFHSLFKFWPDCPYQIYLGSNEEEFSDSRVESILVGPDKEYSTNLIAMLERINTPWVILWIEDLFISEKINSSYVSELVDMAIEKEVGYLKLDIGTPWAFAKDKNKIPKFRYVHDTIGSNYRMTEMQSAIGRIQLKKLENWIEIRRKNAESIFKSVASFPMINIPSIQPYMKHAFYKCYLTVNKNFLKNTWNRDRIIAEMNTRGVRCFSGSCPEIYLEKIYKNYNISRLLNSKKLGEESLMFEVHPSLSKKDIARNLSVIKAVLREASKK